MAQPLPAVQDGPDQLLNLYDQTHVWHFSGSRDLTEPRVVFVMYRPFVRCQV